MSYYSYAHITSKSFCVKCELIQVSGSQCMKCHGKILSVDEKARWPKNPKKSDYRYMSICLIHSRTELDYDDLERVRKFVLRHGELKWAKEVEQKIIKKKEWDEEKRLEALKPEVEYIAGYFNLNNACKEFKSERENLVNPSWIVPGFELFTNTNINVKQLRKIFIPKKIKVKNKLSRHSNAAFSNEQDADIFSHELALEIIRKSEEYLDAETEHRASLSDGKWAEYCRENKLQEVDKKLFNEAKLHLRHCKNSLIDTFPHYYI